MLAPEHQLVEALVRRAQNKEEIEKYVKTAIAKSEIDRSAEGKEKTGVEVKGIKAINPANQEEISVYIADYVIGGYGTGAIMAVPAYDERDREFAEKFNLPVKEVELADKKEITEKVGGKMVTTYKLRDWVFGRQRYWGEPIPMINCPKDGWVPVPEDQLPVLLPETDTFQPGVEGESPLANMTEWVNTTCPVCGGPAKRETDVMPQWAGSSWYYLRYADPKNAEAFASEEKLKYWTPVDWYNGGMEHTTLHLLYSRFWHKALFDLGLVPTSEPYLKRTSHGLILAEGGEKMSKSKGNTVSPDTLVETFGADSLRLYEMFIGPFDQPVAWDANAIMGVRRFLERLWRYVMEDWKPNYDDDTKDPNNLEYEMDSWNPKLENEIQNLIKKVSEDIESLKFNTSVAAFMSFLNLNEIYEEEQKGIVFSTKSVQITIRQLKIFLILLSPFAPHICSELWKEAGFEGNILDQKWPIYDASKVTAVNIQIAVQVNGKSRSAIEIAPGATKDEIISLATKSVEKWLEGTIINTVYVPNRIVNFVLISPHTTVL